MDSQNSDGSWGQTGNPYETALAVAAVSAAPQGDVAVRRGVTSLLSSMNEDGSWSSAACVWEFLADDTDLWRAFDGARTFTTAICTIALRRASGQLQRGPSSSITPEPAEG